jgi:hypothetical protein
LLIGGIFSSAFKQIDAGTVGVTTLYGNVQTGILRSGLNVINPLLMWLTSIFELKTIRCLPREGDQFVMMRFEYCQMTDLK